MTRTILIAALMTIQSIAYAAQEVSCQGVISDSAPDGALETSLDLNYQGYNRNMLFGDKEPGTSAHGFALYNSLVRCEYGGEYEYTADCYDGLTRVIEVRPVKAGGKNGFRIRVANGLDQPREIMMESCTFTEATDDPGAG